MRISLFLTCLIFCTMNTTMASQKKLPSSQPKQPSAPSERVSLDATEPLTTTEKEKKPSSKKKQSPLMPKKNSAKKTSQQDFVSIPLTTTTNTSNTNNNTITKKPRTGSSSAKSVLNLLEQKIEHLEGLITEDHIKDEKIPPSTIADYIVDEHNLASTASTNKALEKLQQTNPGLYNKFLLAVLNKARQDEQAKNAPSTNNPSPQSTTNSTTTSDDIAADLQALTSYVLNHNATTADTTQKSLSTRTKGLWGSVALNVLQIAGIIIAAYAGHTSCPSAPPS
ncbi:MAG TPA: hypothetical protein VEK38_01940 [Candidatus Bathyarchaeia archaeon]|nr:hypothetical protein [Candidatus Bathyarchaeia archaeon]